MANALRDKVRAKCSAPEVKKHWGNRWTAHRYKSNETRDTFASERLIGNVM